jgi:mutator protein MutT
MSNHHKVYVAAYLVLKRDNQIFLLRRANTGYEDGKYGLPSGHVEKDEQPSIAAIREAKEEVGIDALPEDISFVHAMHRLDYGGTDMEYDDFFFLCEKWSGEPSNMEPEKCDECGWFPIDNLPPNTMPYTKQAIEDIQKGKFYREK